MRILILGGAGMLGHKVVQRLTQGADDVRWTLRGNVDDPALTPVPTLRGPGAIDGVDAEDDGTIDTVLRQVRPDIVVNCLGVIKQADAASDADTMMAINGRLPHRIAKTLGEWGGRLIHISTDCVFSGSRGHYAENDPPDADDAYGRSKAAGEVRAPNALVIRTSMIGRELRRHRSLLDWFLQQRGRRIRGFRHAYWSGVTTLHLAEVIDGLIHAHRDLAGVFQLSSGRTSKYALLCELRSRYHLEVDIEPDDTFACDRSLEGNRFEQATGYRCPPLSALIDELVADPTPYPILS